jgi:hypothetical protein
MKDMYAKGRGPSEERSGRYTHPERTARGEHASKSKLTEAQVREIRTRYASGGTGYRTLADEYGVTFAAIRFIVKGKTWTHVA